MPSYNEQIIADELSVLIPKKSQADMNASRVTDEDLQGMAESIHREATARELTELKRKKKDALKRRDKEDERSQELKDDIAVIEQLEEDNLSNARDFALSRYPDSQMKRELMVLTENTRPEISKLLNGLNINLSLALSKNDTLNLLAALLTCNESQLSAIESNPKVPLAIKAVIRRLQTDAKLGNIETIERLWDRIFGKADKATIVQPTDVQATGIIPNTPISREAYLILKQTFIQ